MPWGPQEVFLAACDAVVCLSASNPSFLLTHSIKVSFDSLRSSVARLFSGNCLSRELHGLSTRHHFIPIDSFIYLFIWQITVGRWLWAGARLGPRV